MSYRRLSPILQPKSPVRLPPLLLSILMVFALLAAGLPSPTGAAGTGEAPPREAAPDRASPISDETGAEIRVADFAGRPVLIISGPPGAPPALPSCRRCHAPLPRLPVMMSRCCWSRLTGVVRQRPCPFWTGMA